MGCIAAIDRVRIVPAMVGVFRWKPTHKYIVCVFCAFFPHPKSPRHYEKERRYNLLSFIFCSVVLVYFCFLV